MELPLTAIILAAGYSSRMGAFKPLLPFGGTTVLVRAIELFHGAGIPDIRVVVGYRSEQLLPLLKQQPVRTLLNERFQEGMFSSVVTAAKSLEGTNGAFFLLPVDIPLVRRETIERMIQSYRNGTKGILHPAFRGERGHPPLISASYCSRILSWHGDGGLKALLMLHENDTAIVESDDPGVLLDMDTPEDYERLRESLPKAPALSKASCEHLLLESHAAGSRVIKHCRAVARFALLIAEKLNCRGFQLNLPLIETAALLHDLAKGERDHAWAAAAILRGMGCGAVADLIAVHMDLPFLSEDDGINAAEILFLADKLIEEDRFVPLEIRFQPQLERHAHEPVVLERINHRLECARALQRHVEKRLGLPLEKLLVMTPP